MAQTAKPILSIGMIFKDDIRSLEHCLSALQPLRDALHCELVMADTGSTDGSRAVAEKYADILFDFPWINDFAAARNAVMDRCSGRWFLTVDSDEYLEEDVSQIVSFLKANNRKVDTCTVVVRNYGNYELEGPYTDFLAIRMTRMARGVRYEGAIHEKWADTGAVVPLSKTVFRHDGYVGLNGEEGRAKRERNIRLIRAEIAENPELLMPRLQFIESGATEPDLLDQIREAIALVEEKTDMWDRVGPPILRQAVFHAWQMKLPEVDKWTGLAWELFPDSLYTRIDVAYASFMRAGEAKDYAACAEHGETYLRGVEAQRKGADPGACVVSVLRMAAPYWEQDARILLAQAYLAMQPANPERAVELLDGLDGSLFDGRQTALFVQTLRAAHARTEGDTAPIVTAVWEGISKPVPNEQRARQRRQTFVNEERTSFQPNIRMTERERQDYLRLSCTLFAPLERENEWGRTAAILAERDPDILTQKLAAVEQWEKTPICALAHGLEHGAEFPPPGQRLPLEELDSLAGRLSREGEIIYTLAPAAAGADYAGSALDMAWARALVLAAVRACQWKDEAQGLALAHAFVKVERAFLEHCYTPALLREEELFLLPPMHRFAWYCGEAFAALEGNDPAGYARLLRSGLEACPGMKAMVEFLTEHTPELKPSPARELVELADKVRGMLSALDPEDPAVAAIKQSPVYQKVAYLIEGVEAPGMGGVTQ